MAQTTKNRIRTAHYQDIEDKLRYNKTYFSAYLDYLEKEATIKSKKVYLGQVSLFLEYLDSKTIEISSITTKEIIEQYSNDTKRKIDSVFRNSLKDFLSISGRLTKINITDHEIDQVGENEKPKRSAKYLSLDEIVDIRNELRRNEQYQALFLFEIFLTYGISLSEFENLKKENFSLEMRTFTTASRRTLTLSKMIAELLREHADLPLVRVRGTVQSNIRKIGVLIERDKLIWQDIDKTRKQYFPICPRCQDRYPNTDEFWALVEYQNDDNRAKWFLCRRCIQAWLDGGFYE